jgi:Glycosyl hydrolase family 26/Bacterial Ig domain
MSGAITTTRTTLRCLVLAFSLLTVCASSALAGPTKNIGIESNRALEGSTTQTVKRVEGGSGKTHLAVATQSPTDGQVVSGAIVWQASVTGTPTRVDFAIDGSLKWSQTASPYLYGGSGSTLDTKALTNGKHTLSLTAYGTKGSKVTTTATVEVANPITKPAPEPEPAPTPLAASAPLYWGATIGKQLTGGQAPWDMSAVTSFESLAKKPASLVQFFMPFSNCSTSPCTPYNFPANPLENIRQHGSIPVLSWSSASIPSSINESEFQLSDVISGKYDSYIRSFATAAKAWGHPFFLRFNWEMNGKWFSWAEGVNGNHSGEYVAAWRHVHDIFTAVGATNASWVWCPNVDFTNTMTNLGSLYPGNAYVDWTGLDGYNFGTNPAKPGGWQTFSQIYHSTYSQIVNTVAPSKPMMVAEVASSEYGGSKSAWIKDMLARVPAEYPKIRALLWFDTFSDGMDWPIETTSSATTAFSEGIQSSAYTGNQYSGLSATAIQPPS